MKRKMLRVHGILIGILCLLFMFLKSDIYAAENREVKVAFFPMEGYHTINADGSFGGMDVEYLNALSEYSGWDVQYVKCDSWEEALQLLEDKEVDLVGSAQYSKERAETFQYADLSSGYTFGVIATNPESTIAYEDFTKMQDITYGMVADYVRKPEFLHYLSDNGVDNPTILEYDTTAKLQEALADGEVDAMVHTFTEVKEGQRLIGRFAPKPFYYITYKGNEDVMRELNQATADLSMNQPQLEMNLMNKYYYSKFDKTALLTTEETQFIREHKTVVVGYLDGFYPFSYEEDGEFKGLTRELADESMKAAGLTAEYRRIESRLQAKEMLRDGTIDVLAYCTDTEAMLKKYKLTKVCEYATSPLVLVTDRSGSRGEIETLTTISSLSDEAREAVKTDGVGVAVTIRDTQQECIEAVLSGEADAMLCDGYLIEHLKRTDFNYGNLQIQSVLSDEYSISMAVREEDTMLSGILKKTINVIEKEDINAYMLRENVYPLVSVAEFIRENSITIIIILFAVIILIVLVGLHIINDGRKIQNLMYKDTGMDIWNMNYLLFKGGQKLISDRKAKYALVYVYPVQFRSYTIVYGWHAGERLLQCIANLLLEHTDDKTEICAKGHGDRFVLLLSYTDKEAFMERMQRLKDTVEQWILKYRENHMSLHLGIYYIPQDRSDLRLAVTDANQALEYIGGVQESAVKVYDDTLEEKIREQHERERILEDADVTRDFVAYYQPKVDIRSGEIAGAEALVRFCDPSDGGRIKAPGYFVPYYEQTGKITELDFFVCEAVCKMLRRRMDAGLPVVTVSCNFSRRHFLKPGFPERFTELLARYEISKELVEVEITETLIVEEIQQHMIKKTLEVLKEEGIRLSIDDFGAGYSSLGVFEQIPASVIKLDRSFFLNQEDRGRQIKVMRGIMKLAEELNVQTVCEGVETEEDVCLMKEIGAYLAQGYYYSKPVPETEFEKKLGMGLQGIY